MTPRWFVLSVYSTEAALASLFTGTSQKSAWVKNLAPSAMAGRRLPDLSSEMTAQTQLYWQQVLWQSPSLASILIPTPCSYQAKATNHLHHSLEQNLKDFIFLTEKTWRVVYKLSKEKCWGRTVWEIKFCLDKTSLQLCVTCWSCRKNQFHRAHTLLPSSSLHRLKTILKVVSPCIFNKRELSSQVAGSPGKQ